MKMYESPNCDCKIAQEVDDLRLDRHVERRHGLVAHDEARLDGERARDAHALALAAGEFVRIAARVLRREPDEAQDLGDSLAAASFGEPVQRERLVERLRDGHARIERRERILEDHGQRAAHFPQRILVERREVASLESARCPTSARGAQHEASRRRLPAPRFADERKRLAGIDVEAHAIHRVHVATGAAEQPAPDREMLDERIDAQQRRHCHGKGARQHAAA
jgi:hypothetical protein